MTNSLLARRLSLLAIACGAVILASPEAAASIITIANSSFENPAKTTDGDYTLNGDVTSWTAGTKAGVWNPKTAQFSSVPDGAQIGYINAGTAQQTTVKQTLVGISAQLDTRYILTIQLGRRKDNTIYNPGTSYGVDLLVGTTVVASVTPVALTADTWTTLTAIYDSPLSGLPAGDLGISIHYNATSGSGQLDFDNVRLTSVPEPSTYLAGLSALGILGWFGRKNRR